MFYIILDVVSFFSKGRRKETADLLVFDPRYGMWHREDDTKFVGFAAKDQCIYAVTANSTFDENA